LVIADLNHSQKVEEKNLFYKCKWSPFTGTTFSSYITHTFVNGNLVYEKGKHGEAGKGMRLKFNALN
jgi:dihydroorotase